MPQAVSLLPFLLVVIGYAFAGLSVWPSFHVALSNKSVFVNFSAKSNNTISSMSLSLVNMETNTSFLSRTLPSNQLVGKEEFDCSCFLYAGTFRFLLRQTSITSVSNANGTDVSSTESSATWWSSEVQVHWPTFYISLDEAGNHSKYFQVGLSTNELFHACSRDIDSALFLEVSYMDCNHTGRNTINTVRAQTRKPIKPLRYQVVELPCAFPFTERDSIIVSLRSPHTKQEVKSTEPLCPSHIFPYKLLVKNASAYKSGCMGTMNVKIIAPPCTHVSGKILLYKAVDGKGVDLTSTAMGFRPEEPSPPLAFRWLTQGENETEFNCSVFYPGRNKYCLSFVFNMSRFPSPARTCLVVYKSAESWGPWQPWSVCSVSCGDGVRERVRECLLPSGVRGMQCSGKMKDQSLCSLDACNMLPSPFPSLSTKPVGASLLGGNMIVVLGISLCLAAIMATVVVTVWKKLCQTPQCSSVQRGSIHSPGGRKLSDEASICGHSLQRPSISDGHCPKGAVISQNERPSLGAQSLSPQALVMPLSQNSERSSPTGQKVLPPIFGYRLAQQQLKEMKKQGLKEATQLYHVSSSPVHDTVVETSASPTTSPVPSPIGFPCSALPFGSQDSVNRTHLCTSNPLSETLGVTSERLSPRVELVLGPPVSGRSSKGYDRTADWVEMVERSKMPGLGGGGGHAALGNSYHKNPNFRRTSSFNDTKLLSTSSAQPTPFRGRSMTQGESRTLPEGSSWTKGRWERKPRPSYPIPEHRVSDWSSTKPQSNEQRKAWMETAVPSRNNQVKHTGTNTNNFSKLEKNAKDLSGTGERKRLADPRGRSGEVVSGIGGPSPSHPWSHEVNQVGVDRTERAEQNWNRRGPSPIQRNILARKLKEAQSCSGVKARQRSSSFNVSSSDRSRDWCHSLPMSRDQSSSGGSPYRLSEAEQRMLDLDLYPGFVQEKE